MTETIFSVQQETGPEGIGNIFVNRKGEWKKKS